jgi:hypothetical protein
MVYSIDKNILIEEAFNANQRRIALGAGGLAAAGGLGYGIRSEINNPSLDYNGHYNNAVQTGKDFGQAVQDKAAALPGQIANGYNTLKNGAEDLYYKAQGTYNPKDQPAYDELIRKSLNGENLNVLGGQNFNENSVLNRPGIKQLGALGAAGMIGAGIGRITAPDMNEEIDNYTNAVINGDMKAVNDSIINKKMVESLGRINTHRINNVVDKMFR